jgi:hypothetical protein
MRSVFNIDIAITPMAKITAYFLLFRVQPLTEESTGNIKIIMFLADNLTAICEPIV